MAELKLGETRVVDTFSEAFAMWGARVIITADSAKWARAAANSMTGFATSVISCKCEAAVEREMAETETPDHRPGISVLLFTMKESDMSARLVDRVGQCVMTCPTTACYNGLESQNTMPVGGRLRYFGDGYQSSKYLAGRRLWRIPVMAGEFLVEDIFGIQPAIGGGNLLLLGSSKDSLRAATAAVKAMRAINGVFLPFPNGVVRSGSKIGSVKYKNMIASTNDAYCPTLRGVVPDSRVPEDIESIYEIVVNGLTRELVADAMSCGIAAAAVNGAQYITAANYGGNLGKYKFHLRELING